jgi:hypothetical protein
MRLEPIRAAWARVSPLVATKRAAALLFVISLGVYWVEGKAWPIQRGRDAWDYLAYYLTFFDAHTPFRQLMLSRTPTAPFLLGLPLSIGGVTALQVALAIMFALSVVAWSATALSFSRPAAVLMACALLAFPGFAQLFHEASSDGVAVFGFSLFAFGVVKTCFRPTTARFAMLGAGAVAIALSRPGFAVLLAGCLLPLVIAVSWRRRLVWGGAYLAVGLLLLGSYVTMNGLRWGDFTYSRLTLVEPARNLQPDAGPASRQVAALVRKEVLPAQPYRKLGVDTKTYFNGLSHFEWVRLIAIDDRIEGLGADDRLLMTAVGEARAARYSRNRLRLALYRPGRTLVALVKYLSGPTYREVRLKPAVWPTLPATVSVDGALLPNPPTLPPPLQAVGFGFLWCASDQLSRCVLEHPGQAYSDPGQARRYGEITRTLLRWDSRLGTGVPNGFLNNQLIRIAHWYPPSWMWLLVGGVLVRWRRPRGRAALLALLGFALLVVVGHAWVIGYVRAYAIPVMPVAILIGIVGAVGERGRPEPEAG